MRNTREMVILYTLWPYILDHVLINKQRKFKEGICP